VKEFLGFAGMAINSRIVSTVVPFVAEHLKQGPGLAACVILVQRSHCGVCFMLDPVSHFFHSNWLKLQFWDYGQKEKPPVVLLHGD
jgi:hypothetical protein